MRIGSRLFPYPVINNNVYLSEYKENLNFELCVEFNENGEVYKNRNHVCLKNSHFKLNDQELLKLCDEGKIKCALIVESSSSIYRERFEITTTPKDILLPLHELKNDVYVSSYIYATENIDDFVSSGFNDDYQGYTFDIEKFDILAADDGFRFNIDYNLEEDNKVSSIFTIIKLEESTDVMGCNMDPNKIIIYLSAKYFSDYETMKNHSDFNEIFFAMLVMPVLVNCLSDIKTAYANNDDISDITDDYHWFKSICFSYEKEKGKKLTMDEFKRLTALELAQDVFNYSTTKGLHKFCDLVVGSGFGGELDD